MDKLEPSHLLIFRFPTGILVKNLLLYERWVKKLCVAHTEYTSESDAGRARAGDREFHNPFSHCEK